MTPTGKRICQRSTQGEWKRIQYYFGMTEEAAKKIARSCETDRPTEMIIKLSYIHEWILVETTDKKFPIHGWTTPKNVSFLFFGMDDFTEINFYRTLIHELATSLDSKESWGLLGKLNLATKITRVSYSGDRECEVISAIKRPSIKFATSALRAEVVENQILSELGLLTQEPSRPESCATKILRKVPAVLSIGDIVSADTLAGQFDVRMCGQDSRQSRSLFDDLQLLENERAFDIELEREMSLCDFLTTPRVDSYFIGPYTGGPRPKVEPWDQQRVNEEISEKLVKAYQDRKSPSSATLQGEQLMDRLRKIEESRSEIGRIPDRQNQLRDLLKPTN